MSNIMNKTPSRFESLFGKLSMSTGVAGKPTMANNNMNAVVGGAGTVEKSAATATNNVNMNAAAMAMMLASPRHQMNTNLRMLQSASKRGQFPTDQRVLRLISVLYSQRLADFKVERVVRNIVEQARVTHPELAMKLEQDWARMPTAQSSAAKHVAPRVAKRPTAIRIPLVRVHNERMQEIELLVNYRAVVVKA